MFSEWLLREELMRERKRESQGSEKIITKARKIGGRRGKRGCKGVEKGEKADERRTTCEGGKRKEGEVDQRECARGRKRCGGRGVDAICQGEEKIGETMEELQGK